jgi:hypothetical protein
METRLWRRVMQYWTSAQAYDSGYRQKRERYGGLGQATTSAYTAYGATGLITSLDMAAGVGGRRCSAYRGSGRQLRAIGGSLDWLDQNYTEPFRNLGSLVTKLDAFAEPTALQALGEVSGLSHFNDKDHFAESARELLRHYDRESSMFGVRGEGQSWAEAPSLLRTARALSVLGRGSAPTVCQRIVAGDDERGWGQYNGDVPHLVRYLSAKRGRPLNWRRATIHRDVRELVEVPILVLDVVGPFNWSDAQWNKIREYCFAGGSVVIDFAKGQEAQRAPVVSALRRTFPEYALRALPSDSLIFSIETELSSRPPVQTLGNGVRHFLFVPGESWSCQWHLYDTENHEDSFLLMNNLVTYATDETPLRSSFAPSTYAVRSVPSHSMRGAHLDVGGDVPAHPDLVDAMDRLMQQEYRLAVVETTDPKDKTDVLWVSVTGQAAPSEAAKTRIKEAIRGGTSLLIDVVSGRKDWDERFRAVLEGFEGVKLTKLPRTDPIYTGEIPGTRGFDVVAVNLRRVLHTRFSTTGRCDLYAIFYNGKRVGVYSAYDISSGIGYHYYPGCRGVMPKHARELAMNVFLAAYERKVSEEATR